MDISDEKAAIAACVGGDTTRFVGLYDAYVRQVYTFIYYKTHHKETAEDLTSETFFKALKNIQQFDQSRSFRSWLYSIAHNSVIDHFRMSRPTSDIDDIWDLPSEDNVVRDVETKHAFAEVQKHLASLTSIQREIITMRLWQELSYKEIAEIVGKSEANCKTIYSRAIAQLRTSVPASVYALLLSNLISHY